MLEARKQRFEFVRQICPARMRSLLGRNRSCIASSNWRFRISSRIKLRLAAGGWDYLEVDKATHRVFISRGSHVMVVDPDSGKVVGDIPNTQGVHGIALAPEF